MKVKVSINRIVECEIDDKFRQLAAPYEQVKDLPQELFEECAAAAEKATGVRYAGLIFDPKERDKIEQAGGVIWAVCSAENGEAMVEW